MKNRFDFLVNNLLEDWQTDTSDFDSISDVNGNEGKITITKHSTGQKMVVPETEVLRAGLITKGNELSVNDADWGRLLPHAMEPDNQLRDDQGMPREPQEYGDDGEDYTPPGTGGRPPRGVI